MADTRAYVNRQYKTDNHTIIESMISEGSANLFGIRLNPQAHSQYINISQAEAKKALRKLKPTLKKNKRVSFADSYLMNRRAYPNFAAHQLGFYLMESYVKAFPRLTWTVIASQKPHYIFLKAWETLFNKKF